MGNNKHGVLNAVAVALLILAIVLLWKQQYTLTYFTIFVAFLLRRQAKKEKGFYDVNKNHNHIDD